MSESKKAKRERLRLENLARMQAPKTIKLLQEYPEGPERERAFELVKAAMLEAATLVDKEVAERVSRIVSLLNFDSIDRYLRRGD